MFTTRNDDESDRSSEEVLMISKLMESQEARLQKIEASNSNAVIEALLSKLVESQEIQQKLLETQVHHQQQLLETQARNQQQLLETQAHNQQQMLESLTASFSKGLLEVLNHQNKVLANSIGEKKLNSDDEVEIEEKEFAGMSSKGNADGYNILNEDLFEIAKYGESEKARAFFENSPEEMTKAIATDSETAVHIAINYDQWDFVEEIVSFLPREALELKESHGFTVLHMAALYGKAKTAMAMVSRNCGLLKIRNDFQGALPLETAVASVTNGQHETVRCLYYATKRYYPSLFSGSDGAQILSNAIDYSFYDLAISLVKEYPHLVTEPIQGGRGVCGLEKIINRPFAFRSGIKQSWWETFVYSFIHVDMDSSYTFSEGFESEDNSDISGRTMGDGKSPSEISEGTMGDVENPPDNLEGTMGNVEISKEFLDELTTWSLVSAKGKRLMQKLSYRVLSNMRYLYHRKLMHKQASLLAKCMLEQLYETTITVSEITTFFNTTGIISVAIDHYGLTDFAAQCLEKFPFLLWEVLRDETMIQMAIGKRNHKILNIMLEIGDMEIDALISREDARGNNILHHTAKLAPLPQLNLVSGAALQMQRELQWFKGVERIVHPHYMYSRNADGKTPQSIFTEEHKGLVEKGEKWMKDTSGSCMIVATLIATVAFAAAFTVPGGNISDTSSPINGIPIFLQSKTFLTFVVADAGALFSSITSVIMFLSIMTARYAEQDFLKSLPQKLIIGLATLFLSMASMLVAFGAACSIVLRNRYHWALYPVGCFGLVSILLFAFLEFPLFLEMVRYTYWPTVIKQKNRQPIFTVMENGQIIKQNMVKRVKKEKEN